MEMEFKSSKLTEVDPWKQQNMNVRKYVTLFVSVTTCQNICAQMRMCCDTQKDTIQCEHFFADVLTDGNTALLEYYR